ncbi:hypothetical protein L6164_027449 [Bauhinia variegata]|uniref:Uncharacterized protein n=1 Tax=Bauhinia variegata TaxID=167791 RepID=A0ACB9LUM2_BAUVA|nr:hypothetical protein L6164_027449 [Bauhinia variegata]
MSGPPMWTATHPPFTVAQWQELEHQALIFKYLKAGLPVPPDLLAPIRKSFQLMSAKIVHHPALGYCSYFGKKIDPEPGRCRRTDGKKWRCSRDAHPDSKYCERHMIRRRYRSRKPVESQAAPQSSSTVGSEVASGSRSSSCGSFPSLPLHTNGTREGLNLGNNASQLQIDCFPSDAGKKEYRFALNSEADEHSFLQKGLGSVRYPGFDSTSDGMWSHISQIPSNSVTESRNNSIMVSNSLQLRTMQDADPLNVDAARSKQQHIFDGQLSSAGYLKQEQQSPQSLFSDWQWKRDLGSSAIQYRPSKESNCNPDMNVDFLGSL